jgi:hypothetical protein
MWNYNWNGTKLNKDRRSKLGGPAQPESDKVWKYLSCRLSFDCAWYFNVNEAHKKLMSLLQSSGKIMVSC